MSVQFTNMIKILIFLQISACLSTHLHRHNHAGSRRVSSLPYPLEVCRDGRYWKCLPNPQGVIGYGYNLMTGRLTDIQLFNTSTYNDSECRLVGRRWANGTWDMYRIPGHVLRYSFHHESSDANQRLRYKYRVYNSTFDAVLDAKKTRSFLIDQMDHLKYDRLYLNLRTLPLRYYTGARSLYDAMQDLASHSTVSPVLYSLRVYSETGEFQLKSSENLLWTHLHEKFRRHLRDAIMADDFSSTFFDRAGTHYAHEGTFGGLSDRWWISRRRPERKCSTGEESKVLDSNSMAACDRSRLAGLDDEEIGSNSSMISCDQAFDDERFRPSRWMVTSGGPSQILKSAHTQQAAFNGRSSEIQLQWLNSLNEEPSTVRVGLIPICDLLPLIDQRPWHYERCQEHLLEYIKTRDPFYAPRMKCSTYEKSVKFVKNDANQKSAHRKCNISYSHYCISATVYQPERSCRMNVLLSRACKLRNIWISWFLCVILLTK